MNDKLKIGLLTILSFFLSAICLYFWQYPPDVSENNGILLGGFLFFFVIGIVALIDVGTRGTRGGK